LLLRDLALSTLLDGSGNPLLDDGAGIWASSQCGSDGSWAFRSFLDPADTDSFPPPERTNGSEPNASYGLPRPNGNIPVWDREEIYADQFDASSVYAGFGPAGGTDDTGTADRYFDTLLASSHDGARTWHSIPLFEGGFVDPIMMTSNPGRLFTFDCEGPPVLRWSDDGGSSFAGSFVVTDGVEPGCAAKGPPSGWGFEGSQSVTRISYTKASVLGISSRADLVRVIYPAIAANGKQVGEVFSVQVGTGMAPTATHIATIAEPNTDVIQIAIAGADPSQLQNPLITTTIVGGITLTRTDPTLAAALVTWKSFDPAGPVRLRGAFFDSTGALGPAFDISEAWPSPDKTGDYSKIAFFADASGFNYFVPWIAQDASGTRTLLSTIIHQGAP
jgi:hypothetical protein